MEMFELFSTRIISLHLLLKCPCDEKPLIQFEAHQNNISRRVLMAFSVSISISCLVLEIFRFFETCKLDEVLCTQVNKMYVIATLSVYPHRASLKNMPGHGGVRTYDLWNASPMLCQLSYAVRSVRVYDISELSLVPSIPM